MAALDLADLDAFAGVAAERSFRGAAALRGVSASSLSEAVRRLERRLGVRLLNRTTRSVTPTEAGLRLLGDLRPALAAVEAALDVVNGFRDTPRGTLRLNVPTIVASHVLAPIACAFLAAHPEIALEVTTDDSFVDVLAAGFDAGVRYDERLDADMIAVPLGPPTQRFVAGAAPSYLAARGRPEHPRDLLQHGCIRHRFASGRLPWWEFAQAGELFRVEPPAVLTASTMALELAAAEAGLGIVASFEEFLAPSFASGRLAPVLQPWWQTFSGPRLYYAGNKLVPAPLRAFIDFIKAARHSADGVEPTGFAIPGEMRQDTPQRDRSEPS